MRVIKKMKIKTNIQEIRLKRGMTQEQLSRMCDISNKTIQNLEKDVNKNIEIICKIKDALGCSLDDLFTIEK
ncbi:helix-turn-helix transcriptional regulator [Clostridium sporogenes]|uniref:helix-turn-helix transcriptional regulator n=1 Tax=Clostridium sporogenes TaxID=1509 RepID=UPI0013D853D4|nr:helix-turn-helix transcriptional regulator [Clostridium sporogenes]NFV14560.1 helix-turn-helix transcriptional regulator [Clostridium sporogenes]